MAEPSRTRPPGMYLMRATAVNWLYTLLTIVYALFTTPLVVRTLDAELYGVWSFLNGLLAYSSLFYIGLGAAFIRYLAQYRAQQDRPSANRLASVVFVIYTAIGTLSLLACIAIAPFISNFLAVPLAPAAAQQTAVACMLLGGRLLFMFVATIFSGVLIAEERMMMATTISIAGTVARFAAVPLLLHVGLPLVTLAVIMTVSAAMEAAAMAIAAFNRVPGLRLRPGVPQRAELRVLYGFGIRAFFVDLSGWIINYTDVIVVGAVIGAAGVTAYSIPLQLVTYGRVAVQGMLSALLPRLTAYDTHGEDRALASAYLRVCRNANFVAGFIAASLLTLGMPFLRLWIGEAFSSGSSMVLVCLALAGYFQAVGTQTAVPFYQARQALRVPVLVLLAEAAANLALSLVLARRMGVNGVALGTILPTICISLLLLPRHLCSTLKIPLKTLVTSAILPSFVLMIVIVAANLLLDLWWTPSSYALLAVRTLINVSLAGAVAVAILPPEDIAVVSGLRRHLTHAP